MVKLNININISNRALYFFITVILFVIVSGIVYAYNSDFNSGQPSLMGHSPDEIHVNISGEIKSLQQAIDNGDFGGGASLELGVVDCYVIQPWNHVSGICKDGFYVKGDYGYRDDNWDGIGVMCCRVDPSIDDPTLPDAETLNNACPFGWPRIQCNAASRESYPSGWGDFP